MDQGGGYGGTQYGVEVGQGGGYRRGGYGRHGGGTFRGQTGTNSQPLGKKKRILVGIVELVIYHSALYA